MAPNIRIWKREAEAGVADAVEENVPEATTLAIFGHKHHKHVGTALTTGI
jgi:hypothetical protein